MNPSKAKLEQAFPGHGAKLRDLLTGKLDPMTYPKVAQWVGQCYNTPRQSELIERALDAELAAHVGRVQHRKAVQIDTVAHDVQAIGRSAELPQAVHQGR